MHAGLVPTVTESDALITMLDGGLGAVIDPSAPALETGGDTLCWCGCVICFVSVDEPAGESQLV